VQEMRQMDPHQDYESLFLGLILSGIEVYGIMPLLAPPVLLPLGTFASSLNQAGQEGRCIK